MDKKPRPIYIFLPRDPFEIKRYTRLKVKGWRKIFHANGMGGKGWNVITYI